MLKVGLIGCGRISKAHFPGFAQMDNIRIKYACDLIEEKAQAEYEVRMDQARATADGIYVEAAERIANVVDDNMDRLYDLLDQFIYSKTLPGRVEAFIKDCKVISAKIAGGVNTLSKIPGKAYGKAKDTCASVKGKVQNKVNTYKAAIAAAKAAD